ncbi:MAG: metal ABC transporter permease [Actinomycetota bacterium]|nr:metal ABC transporter permease [Actinomycetota bacterium]
MTSAATGLSWDLLGDLRQMLAYQFMVNALIAGTAVAVMAAAIGWFMVLRRQAFAGHTLSVISFPGATGTPLLGLSPVAGYFGVCAAGAVILARGSRATADDERHQSAQIGTLQAFALGCGFLFATLYRGELANVGALLFGTFLGITNRQVLVLLAVALASLSCLAVTGRRLLLCSLDPAVAGARGLSVDRLSLGFLLVLGLAVAATAQITGALLVFALLVMPAATAQTLTRRPSASLALTVALALTVTWLGLAIAFFSPYPVGFWITSLAFALLVAARAGRRLAGVR